MTTDVFPLNCAGSIAQHYVKCNPFLWAFPAFSVANLPQFARNCKSFSQEMSRELPGEAKTLRFPFEKQDEMLRLIFNLLVKFRAVLLCIQSGLLDFYAAVTVPGEGRVAIHRYLGRRKVENDAALGHGAHQMLA